MADLLQQLDPGKLVLTETVGLNDISVDQVSYNWVIDPFIRHISIHCSALQFGNISFWYLRSREHRSQSISADGE
jgi:hypothetical protein